MEIKYLSLAFYATCSLEEVRPKRDINHNREQSFLCLEYIHVTWLGFWYVVMNAASIIVAKRY
jgi:hypothetical protein